MTTRVLEKAFSSPRADALQLVKHCFEVSKLTVHVGQRDPKAIAEMQARIGAE